MFLWPSIAVCILFFFGFLLVAWLCAIDLKLRLLPDELVFALAVCGVLFRWAAWPYVGPWWDAAAGAAAGAGALGLIRLVANRIYGFETMGLGDIKLIGAAGIWLGLEGAIEALCAGAMMGLLHGIALLVWQRCRNGKSDSFREMTIPAGPGFCAGAVLVAVIRFAPALPLFATGAG
ncbi:MAG: prepilin peptidase [Rhodospirillales bacterium]|nr:prepilin peptidase [Alphaproteobacteria bacterium]MCB9986771.1 prepilin peptidase [Rhodospirillales bacterium]USO08458.1 MAG: prepilin peptidase [Rhodospirillales bacterium]